MYFKLIYEESGSFIDNDNNYCSLLSAENYIDTAEGRNIDCVELNSEQEAIEYFGLIKIKSDEPTQENIGLFNKTI